MMAIRRKRTLPLLLVLSLVVSLLAAAAAPTEKVRAGTYISTFPATDDTWMWGTTRMPGDGVQMNVATNGKTGYLKFTVEDVGDVVSATLRLTGNKNGTATISVYSASHADWTEETLNWTIRPSPVDELDRLENTSFQIGNEYDFDVSDLVTGDGTYAFLLKNLDGDEITFSTKEGTAAPVLIVTYEADPPLFIYGNTVGFSGSGQFVDPLDNPNHIFAMGGLTLTNGTLRGPGGHVIYSAGEAEFKRVAIEVTFDKWHLNYLEGQDLTVTEAVYVESTGKFVDVREVPLVRELRPDQMENRNIVKAVYISGPIAPGTQYLRIRMPRESNFRDPSVASAFVLDAVKLHSADADFDPVELLIDDMSGFDLFAEGTDTSNLEVVDLSGTEQILNARTFASLSYIRRIDATQPQTITYEAPDGKEFMTAYVEGYYNFKPPRNFEVWTSEDGETFTNVTESESYRDTPFVNNGQWLPSVLKIAQLPAGTKFVQVRFPNFTSQELYGMKHPHMTQIALGVADPGSNPVEPPDDPPLHPAEADIPFTTVPMYVDGVVGTNAAGAPAGEWAGAGHISIAGEIDANGDEHRADIFLKYDYDNLYIGARIKDPTPMVNNNTGANIWNGDNLEFFIGTEDLDFALYPDKAMGMLPSDVQIVISGSLDYGLQYYRYQNSVISYPEYPLVILPDEDGKGYTIEAAVPLKLLGVTEAWADQAMLFSPVLNDGGVAKRGQWGWTTVGETVKKSRSLWGLVTFEPVSPPPVEITVNASVNAATKIIPVAGQTLNVQSADVTLAVWDAGGKLAHVDQKPSDGQGEFVFTFTLNDDVFGSGVYTVVVGGDGVGRPNTTAFEYDGEEENP